MAHYAFLNDQNIVVEVIVGKDENEGGINWEEHYGNFRGKVCKRTSYNTKGNAHKLGGTPFRKNYAGIGYTYREDIDAFIPPQPYSSWLLDEETGLWESPIPIPSDDNQYVWNEETQSWDVVTSEN